MAIAKKSPALGHPVWGVDFAFADATGSPATRAQAYRTASEEDGSRKGSPLGVFTHGESAGIAFDVRATAATTSAHSVDRKVIRT